MKVFFTNKSSHTLWHVSFKGATDTEFAGGIYHCSLDLKEYPAAAPHT